MDNKIILMKMIMNWLDQVGLGVIGIGTAATLAATFALAQQ